MKKIYDFCVKELLIYKNYPEILLHKTLSGAINQGKKQNLRFNRFLFEVFFLHFFCLSYIFYSFFLIYLNLIIK